MEKDIAARISDSELEIMKCLWQAGKALSITEIRSELQGRMGWESTTVKTLVQRLCTKGALLQEKKGVFYYSALIDEQEYKRWAAEHLMQKLYHGSARELVAALLHADRLTAEDVEELGAWFNRESGK